MKSKFEKWFVAQFGKCPMSNSKALKLESDLQGMEMDIARIRRELRDYRDWYANERAARYAWNVKKEGA